MQMCEAVYLFLEELDVPKKLEALRIRAEESGDFYLRQIMNKYGKK